MRKKIVRGIPLVALLCFGLWGWHFAATSEYRSFVSPDGHFKIVVNRLPAPYAAAGPEGSPGLVRLIDLHNGRTLRRQNVEMIFLIDRVTWTPADVEIGQFANWPLPK